MNKVIEIGRTTQSIELKKTPSGKSIATFGIAVKRNYKNAEGEYESDFFNCVARGNLAEVICRFVKKGDMIAVDGRLQTRKYTDKEGNNRYSTEIIVDNVEFLTPKKQEEPQEFAEVETDPFADLGL